MTKEIVEAVGVLEREKGISADRLMAALEDALLSAYKKTPGAAKYARVEVDRGSGDFRVYELLLPPELEEQLLDEVEEELGEPTVDPETGDLVYPEPPEIDQERLAQYRDQIDEHDVTPEDFGRIAAQTAKQVILQRIREAERDMMFHEYQDRVGELITAIDGSGPVPRPGQFYMLASEEGWGGGADERPYLPRAFSHARARRTAEALELDFVLETVGPGTARLAALEPGDGLALVGPLGVGFRPPPQGADSLLVGGGIGVAPLLALSDELADDAGVLLGFRTAAHAQAAALFTGSTELATDDGSVGRRALVTDLLRERLSADGRPSVFACGPPAMLEGVRALCAEHDVPAQLALESGMACGFGACFGCVVPTRAGYVRLCVEGPVLDADRLDTVLFPGAGH
jgi:dihydroorotate dehydrogenase electron transfer subunit